MDVRWSKVYDYSLARNPESERLECRDGSQQALLYSGIGKSYKMNSDSGRDVHLHSDIDCLHAYTLGAVNVYQHKHYDWEKSPPLKFLGNTAVSVKQTSNIALEKRKNLKKKKKVVIL